MLEEPVELGAALRGVLWEDGATIQRLFVQLSLEQLKVSWLRLSSELLLIPERAAKPQADDNAEFSDSDDSVYTPEPKSASSAARTPNGASGSATPMDSEDESDAESSDLSDSDDSDVPLKKGKKRWGAGRRLETGELDVGQVDPAMWDDQDLEAVAARRAAAREKRRADELKDKPIKAREKALKKELGRRLTNGEKNLIRLQHVCRSSPYRLYAYLSIMQNWPMFGEISLRLSSPSNRLQWRLTLR